MIKMNKIQNIYRSLVNPVALTLSLFWGGCNFSLGEVANLSSENEGIPEHNHITLTELTKNPSMYFGQNIKVGGGVLELYGDAAISSNYGGEYSNGENSVRFTADRSVLPYRQVQKHEGMFLDIEGKLRESKSYQERSMDVEFFLDLNNVSTD